VAHECTDLTHVADHAYCPAANESCPTEQRAIFDCGRYVCDAVQGACLQRCDTVNDCAPPFVCNPDHQCVSEPGVAVGTDPACAFAPGSPAGGGTKGALVALALAALWIARRRWRWGAWALLGSLVTAAACGSEERSDRTLPERS